MANNVEDVRTAYSRWASFAAREFLTWVAFWMLAVSVVASPIDTAVSENLQAWQYVYKAAAVATFGAVTCVFIWRRFKIKEVEAGKPTA